MKNNIKQICDLLAETNDSSKINHLLESFFTPAELADLDSRWEILKRLNKGETQRKIAKDLHLGLCKITRGSKELKKPNSILKKIITKIEKEN
ncbi:MAG: transcriptional regulator [Calditrichaeota bacterium]|nr:MAG: transcriptional regulator [Calditrichota bacterium]MBL1206238.1 transcriptional regulator [Calditrichota bacterium]NOG46064.1 transcriptional regulator [Calditrichota bacterium]